MEFVLSTYSLARPGGSESYLLTLAEHLERLGHSVILHAAEAGEMATVARKRSLRVAEKGQGLPDESEAIIVQDRVSAFELADRYPGVPQLFVSHADAFDLQTPPQLPGIAAAAVVFNDRVEARLTGLAVCPRVERLRQPVDVDHLRPQSEIAERPRRALVLSNYLRGRRRQAVEEACADSGLELTQVGAPGELSRDPRAAIMNSDIVFGYGRSALEAMAAERAVFVLDHKGGDGWVTPESYERLEADGFGGRATPEVLTGDKIALALRDYRQEMGVANRDLVVSNHAAHVHAAQIVEVVRGLGAVEKPSNDLLSEVGRLTRLGWRSERRALHFEQDNEELRRQLEGVVAELAETRRAQDELKATRRYRLAKALAAPLDAIRGATR